MLKKTYYAKGMLEWSMKLKLNDASLRIHFTGGTITLDGISPARFVTTNPAIQHIIENSGDFKKRRIYYLESEVKKVRKADEEKSC